MQVTAADLGEYLELGDRINTARAELLISLATDLCETVLSPLPDSARAVVLPVAARAYTNPQSLSQQSTGPYSAAYGPNGVAGGLYLSRGDKTALRRLAGKSTAFSINMLPEGVGDNLPFWDAEYDPEGS